MKEKLCQKCEHIRPIVHWWKSSRTKDGLQTTCRFCQKAYQTASLRDPLNQIRKNENTVKWQSLNPDKYKASRQVSWMKLKYNLTPEQYEKMLEDQGGKCKICGSTDVGSRKVVNRFAIDHCHTTGTIRGLLCSPCNTGLGLFKDDIDRLTSAINYLRSNNDPGTSRRN